MVVGTHLSFLIVDPETGEYFPFDNHQSFYHWGITWSDKFIFTCVWMGRRAYLTTYDLNFNTIRIAEISRDKRVTAPHQIIWFDNRLWIANTQYDYVSIYDPDNDSWDIWRMYDDSIYKTDDKKGNNWHHMNGVWFHKGYVFVCAHNNNHPSFIQIHNYPDMKHLGTITIGKKIHNVWPEGNELLTCSSDEGKIITTNGREVVNTGGFPRGVAITDKYNCIGVSSYSASRGGVRDHKDGEINIYDKEWKLIRSIVPKGFGQIFEMRMIGEKDISHWEGSEKVNITTEKYNETR